jgi:predicted RNase H-like nuclease (RuvC/YqgF family)
MSAMGRDQLIRSLSELQGRYKTLEERNIALAAENADHRRLARAIDGANARISELVAKLREKELEVEQYTRRVKEVEARADLAVSILRGDRNPLPSVTRYLKDNEMKLA